VVDYVAVLQLVIWIQYSVANLEFVLEYQKFRSPGPDFEL
jgi:hypothetical protein